MLNVEGVNGSRTSKRMQYGSMSTRARTASEVGARVQVNWSSVRYVSEVDLGGASGAGKRWRNRKSKAAALWLSASPS